MPPRSQNIFIGISASEEVIETLARITADLGRFGENIKTVHPEDFHLTYQFLGPIRPEFIDDVAEITRQTALQFNRFEVLVKGLGMFLRRGKPSVIWAGIHSSQNAQGNLTDLHTQIETALIKSSVEWRREQEHAVYQPHITIARMKFDEKKILEKNLIEKLAAYEPVHMPIDNIAVMFNAGGDAPRYRTYKKFALAEPSVRAT